MTSGLGATVTVDATADRTRAVRTACPDGVDAVAGLVPHEPGSFAGYAALARPGGLALSARSGGGRAARRGGRASASGCTARLVDAARRPRRGGGSLQTPEAAFPLRKAPDALARSRAGRSPRQDGLRPPTRELS